MSYHCQEHSDAAICLLPPFRVPFRRAAQIKVRIPTRGILTFIYGTIVLIGLNRKTSNIKVLHHRKAPLCKVGTRGRYSCPHVLTTIRDYSTVKVGDDNTETSKKEKQQRYISHNAAWD